MSDIQEEQKRLYKRAEENDRTNTISIQDLFDERIKQNKRIEELSLALENAEQRIDKATNYINELQDRINKAIETIKDEGLVVAIKIINEKNDETLLSSKDLLIDILKGSDKE